MFYDNFTQDQVCGLFSLTHIITIFVVYGLIALALFFSRKITKKTAKIIMIVISCLIIAMEIVKISLRIYKGEGPGSYVPLYYCSMFCYALILIHLPNNVMQKMGWTYIVYGGMVAGCGFILFPTTSLAIQPIWHPGSIHSLLYHGLMAYSGFLALIVGLYKPRLGDFFYYFFFTGIISVIAAVFNSIYHTNMMFFTNPFGLPFLQFVIDFSPTVYALLMYFLQCILLYFGAFGLLTLIKYCVQKIKNKRAIKAVGDNN